MTSFDIEVTPKLGTATYGVLTSEETGFSFSKRIGFLKAFGGHSMSFSALQPGMRYFDLDEVGYIAFCKKWGTVICLGNPVCAPENLNLLLDKFLEKYPNPVFIQVTPDLAEILIEKTGFYATQFGKETLIDLNDWSLSGKKKQVIRTAVNRAAKEGIVVKADHEDTAFLALSESWLKTRRCKGREIVFLIRPMEMAYSEGVRRFFAYQDNELIGFIFFDPVYEDNRVLAYVPNVSRASEKFPQGIFYLLMVEAMKQFKSEGVPYIHFGLSPLAMNYPPRACESLPLRRMMEFTLRRLNFLYSFKGIDFTKTRFMGKETPTYVVHGNSIPVKAFIATFRLCNLI